MIFCQPAIRNPTCNIGRFAPHCQSPKEFKSRTSGTLSIFISAMETTTPKKDRSHWPTAKFTSFDEARAYRIRQWQEAGCTARLQAAWELVEDYWVGMKGMKPDELRLQRSVTHIRSRGR